MAQTSNSQPFPDPVLKSPVSPTEGFAGEHGLDPASELAEEERMLRTKQLDERLAANSLAGYWHPRARPPRLSPILWRWADIHEGLVEAADIIRLGSETIRRVILLRNPDLPAGSSRTLTMSAQLVNPGEHAPAHRHTAQAVRFMVQGSGAFTTVDGERMPMEPNDLVLTPGWTWHDHTNPSDEPAIWLDGLDIPLALHLDSQFQVDHPEVFQPVTKTDGSSRRRLGNVRLADRQDQMHEYPPYRYPWAEVRAALDELQDSTEADDPHDGVVFEYVNPLTGGHTLPTISCRVQLLRPGSVTTCHRHTSTSIYHVIEGSGRTIVEGHELSWGPRDCFYVPSWQSHWFENASKTDPVILFSISDLPAIEALRLYREEAVDS